MSVHGRFRVATEKTMFAMPETAIGLFPDVGMTHVLPRLAGGLGSGFGMYIGLTGVRLAAADLRFVGLATHALQSAALPPLQAALAREPANAAAILAESEAHAGLPGTSKLEAAAAAIARCFGEQHASVESIVEALAADRDAAWAAQTLTLLRKMSPTSLKVSHRLLRAHADATLAEALRTEYVVSQRCLKPGADFYEGIRAVLVDKGAPPARWVPATLGEVTPALVDAFFRPLSPENQLAL